MRILVFLLFIPFSMGLAISDSAGDVTDSLGLGISGPDDYLDILSLNVMETIEGNLHFSLELADYQADPTTILPGLTVFASIAEREIEFRPQFGCPEIAAYQNDRLMACIPFDEREPLSWMASRELFGYPRAGAEVYVSASTRSLLTPGPPGVIDASHFVDFAPDTGSEALVYAYENRINSGGAVVSTEQPVQLSNGAQKWFLFDLTSELTDAIQPKYEGPEKVVMVGPSIVNSDAKSIPVFVRVQSQHTHGDQVPFKFIIDNQTINLGIQFEDFPNPSGHHQTLFLHSSNQPSSQDAALGEPQPIWMNALPDDRFIDVTDEPVEGRWRASGIDPEPFSSVEWNIPLSPAPRLSMQFENGSAVLSIELNVDQDTPVSMDAALIHCPQGYKTNQCLGEPRILFQESFSFDATAGLNHVEVDLPSVASGGIVSGGTLELQLDADLLAVFALPVGILPELLVSSSSISLPLLDIEEPDFDALIAAPDFLLEGNPGDLMGVGSTEFDYIVLEGPFSVNGGVIEIPLGHEFGDFEILLAGVSSDGEYFISSEIVSVIPEEEKQVVSFEEQESPPLGILFLVGLLMVAVRLRKS
jgi:hypothetical protein